MSRHAARIEWIRQSDDFSYKTYDRNHRWHFEGGEVVNASAAPAYFGDDTRIDPEEALVASLSACHMLTYLALAAYKGFVIDKYVDKADGVLEKNEDGKLAITKVTLRPDISYSGDKQPTEEDIKAMHEKAHKECFIANSVKTEILVEHEGAVIA